MAQHSRNDKKYPPENGVGNDDMANRGHGRSDRPVDSRYYGNASAPLDDGRRTRPTTPADNGGYDYPHTPADNGGYGHAAPCVNAVSPSKATEEKKPGLFHDVSFVQVLAGALAAVTSLLLSSQIGIAGSVIGVFIASIVSTVSSQVYKNVMAASADKIRGLHGDDASTDGTDADATTLLDGTARANATPVSGGQNGTTTLMDANQRPSSSTSSPYSRDAYASHAHGAASSASTHGGAASHRATEQAAASQRKKTQARVIIVSVISALAAVAICALVINLTTSGNGIGAKTAPLFVSDSTTTVSTPSSNTHASGKTPSAQTQGTEKTSASTSSTQTDTTTSTNTSATTPTTDTSGTGTGNSSSATSTTTTTSTGTSGSGSSNSSSTPSTTTTTSTGTSSSATNGS